MLLILTIQRQRCIKILCPKDPELHTALALSCQKGQHLPALEVYKNQSPKIIMRFESCDSSHALPRPFVAKNPLEKLDSELIFRDSTLLRFVRLICCFSLRNFWGFKARDSGNRAIHDSRFRAAKDENADRIGDWELWNVKTEGGVEGLQFTLPHYRKRQKTRKSRVQEVIRVRKLFLFSGTRAPKTHLC